MRTRGDKRPNRRNDRKVLVAEESNRNWADTDLDSSSSSSSSSDNEHEEVHCLMADQTSDDEISEPWNKKGKDSIGYDRPESSKSGWLKNRLDKEKAKSGSKSFVRSQQRRGSKKVKSE
ncbi:hypothetical protein F511_31083 [Dorcoceras hygrometricum]|uniref:Uncharacterized protein n=1 Tax=Dorcoceras hygrometricum TaxID=472368 RepID=A0A2Z7BUY4_9LAMI|nr:hypothetical protein F511_31083 [Dorcoceras hygrometricum]